MTAARRAAHVDARHRCDSLLSNKMERVMRTILLAAGCALAALSATASAHGDAPAAACYIEIQKLMAEPPAGIGELGAAIRELDAKLRPQVEVINALKAQIARLERRVVQTAPSTSIDAALYDDDSATRQ